MRPRASHPRPHSYVDSRAALSPHGGGMNASARQRSRSCKQDRRAPRWPKPIADSPSYDGEDATVALASGSFPAHAPRSEEQGAPASWGRRPQMPGQPVALARVSGTSPGDRLSPVTGSAGSAAIIRRAQELSRFAEPTFRQIVAPRNTKTPPPCAETVDVASSLWKPEENLRQIAGVTLRERRGNPAAEILSACEGSLRHLPSQFFQSLAAVRASGDSIMWSGHSCPLPLTLFRPESAD
jgi:hypothetical protein